MKTKNEASKFAFYWPSSRSAGSTRALDPAVELSSHRECCKANPFSAEQVGFADREGRPMSKLWTASSPRPLRSASYFT